MQALWDWAFSSDGTIYKLASSQKKILLMPGDKVRVFSDRHQCWFDDGVVECTYRDCIRVKYGLERYFGFSLTKGNRKYLKTADIEKKIRILNSQCQINNINK